jgi:hypothetical protein
MGLVAFLASRGEKPCSPRTGSYCKARKRLPEKVLSRLPQETAARMTQEATADGPRTLSFQGALQTIHAFRIFLRLARQSCDLYSTMLAAIARRRVGDRPNRSEPRARKQRPKPYPHLTTHETNTKKLH